MPLCQYFLWMVDSKGWSWTEAWDEGVHDHYVTHEVDTLATALCVRTENLPAGAAGLAPWRPKIGVKPRLTDAELVTLAVMQALLGFTSGVR